MRAPRDTASSSFGLLQWCRQTCAIYPNVDINNLSSAFRDGLAFCAIIHKHRPDLIDFNSLSAANVYENNQLAFSLAESRLGIPAFLVPEDLLASPVPDCLGVLTYLSKFYHYFSTASHAFTACCESTGLQSSGGSSCGKTAGPSNLRSAHLVLPKQRSPAPPSFEDGGRGGRRAHASCPRCLQHVHLVQRHLVRGEVYHRSCFRCKVCRSTLLAGFHAPGEAACSVLCSEQVRGCARSPCDLSLGVPQGTEAWRSRDKQVVTAAERPMPSETSLSPCAMFQPAGVAQATEDGRPSGPTNRDFESDEGTEMEDLHSKPSAGRGESKQLAQVSQAGSPSMPGQSSASPSLTQKSPVKRNHPWLRIIHPGPWTQLPPLESPVPFRQSRSGLSWYRPKVPPPNPFTGDLQDQTKDVIADATSQIASSSLEAPGDDIVIGDPVLSRSCSQPAVKTPGPHHMTDSQVCQENDHCDRKTEMAKSETCQVLTPGRPPAPGHGFPLVKRKVQVEQSAPAGDLQAEARRLNDQLEALEERGVAMEENLRKCKNDEEEDHLLSEWRSLIRERDSLMRRDTELVYLTKQGKLEERQAEVDFQLRRLLNKPESVWSEEDKSREESLMAELVLVIEQRNHIVSTLDQDRQREREEDVLWEVMSKNQELEKEGLKERRSQKESSGPANVFKRLNLRVEHAKQSWTRRAEDCRDSNILPAPIDFF
ncbi:MICAL-like protein 1 isoform X2 [Nerophis ophidion]|uniref:MICAL-like protein 1 isoform X2 n=1 Tax=Nerophis ophidion TaxID=159077 RepID=UPI002ADF7228|nr:MICAL-like protein 1 isoform X2 [Nerophis ophidion]